MSDFVLPAWMYGPNGEAWIVDSKSTAEYLFCNGWKFNRVDLTPIPVVNNAKNTRTPK